MEKPNKQKHVMIILGTSIKFRDLTMKLKKAENKKMMLKLYLNVII